MCRRVVIATVLLGLVPAACATLLEPDEVICPVCGERVLGYQVVETNTNRGVDWDLCPHAEGEQPVYHQVWTCLSCLYSGRVDDFYDTLSDQEREALRGRLVPYRSIPDGATNFTLAASIKYDLAVQCGRILNASPANIGTTALSGAWAVRLEAEDGFVDRSVAGYLVGDATGRPSADDPWRLDLWTAERLLARAATAPEMPDDMRALLGLYAAKLFRVRGELVRVEEAVAQVRAWDAAAVRSEEIAGLLESVTRERRFLVSAIESLDRALSLHRERLPKAEVGRFFYLIGEMYRQLNDPRRAVLYYEAGLDVPDTIPAVEARMRDQLVRVRARLPEGAEPPPDGPRPAGLTVRIPPAVLEQLRGDP